MSKRNRHPFRYVHHSTPAMLVTTKEGKIDQITATAGFYGHVFVIDTEAVKGLGSEAEKEAAVLLGFPVTTLSHVAFNELLGSLIEDAEESETPPADPATPPADTPAAPSDPAAPPSDPAAPPADTSTPPPADAATADPAPAPAPADPAPTPPPAAPAS